MNQVVRNDPELEVLWQKIDAAGVRNVALVASRLGEGTTSIAIALARRAATAGRSVLLVDLNRGSPGVAAALGLTVPPDAIVSLPGQHLSVLAELSPDKAAAWREPAQLTAQAERWRDDWDLVVFDAAPVLARDPGLISGSAVAMAAEATVLVALAGRTPA